MSEDQSETPRNAILAAGGIVLGTGDDTGKIAIVRRRRYQGEIALPKGKLKEREGAIEAALREVYEETGCKTKVTEYAGTTNYFAGGVPKAVLYFVMTLDGECRDGPKDTREIEAVEWVTPKKALAILTHLEDRDLIAAVFGIRPGKTQ
jgi:8-oxo-dGTP diphosphatase